MGWGRGNRPVIDVDWEEARAYAAWLSNSTNGLRCSLPSEAEWEYAARAGTTTAYALPAPQGSDDMRNKGLANCADCGSARGGEQTAPVGRFHPNAWGLHDMRGNAWEWTEDCWHEDYNDAPDDGQAWLEEDGGDCELRVVRGGSWADAADALRSAHRRRSSSDNRYNDLGFRVVCRPLSSTEH
jgi:formylglycine-generating enzyme required for sulfatase activity